MIQPLKTDFFPENPKKEVPFEHTLVNVFRTLMNSPEDIQKIIQQLEDRDWVADLSGFHLIETAAKLHIPAVKEDALWAQILQYLIENRQTTLSAEQAFTFILDIVKSGGGEQKAIQFWNKFSADFTEEEKSRLLPLVIRSDYRDLFRKLLPAIKDPDISQFKTKDNPFTLARSKGLVDALVKHGFSLTDEDSQQQSGVFILRERDRQTFEDFKARDAIVKQLMDVEKNLPQEKRFEIAIKTAKKWPDIQFALKFLGSDWMNWRFGKDKTLHPLHVIAQYQPDYLGNVLQRKEVREAPASWFELDPKAGGIPFWIPLWTSDKTAQGVINLIKQLRVTTPQLFPDFSPGVSPSGLLWDYVQKENKVFPLSLKSQEWMTFNLDFGNSNPLINFWKEKENDPEFGAQLEQQMPRALSLVRSYRTSTLFFGLETLPINCANKIPQLINVKISWLVTSMKVSHYMHEREIKQNILDLENLLNHPAADWQKVNKLVEAYIPAEANSRAFPEWDQSLKAIWEKNQMGSSMPRTVSSQRRRM